MNNINYQKHFTTQEERDWAIKCVDRGMCEIISSAETTRHKVTLVSLGLMLVGMYNPLLGIVPLLAGFHYNFKITKFEARVTDNARSMCFNFSYRCFFQKYTEWTDSIGETECLEIGGLPAEKGCNKFLYEKIVSELKRE
ncbi:MAG: hypothetical protein VX777_07480 [Chlamydiota bacterium]|nr:hypothetical protein [Chlamydiota bacterium]